MKNIKVFCLNFFQFGEVKFSIYMNRRVFVMVVFLQLTLISGCIFTCAENVAFQTAQVRN